MPKEIGNGFLVAHFFRNDKQKGIYMRLYPALRSLKNDGVLMLEDGTLCQSVSGPIVPGALYIAERNTGPMLLTCQSIAYHSDGRPDFVVPVCLAYAFDWHECVHVVIRDKQS